MDNIKHIKQYEVVYPKNMDELEYDELVEVFNETMELLANAIRFDVFNDYNGEWPKVGVNV